MALSINTNSSALLAIVAASSSNRETETSLERLSSGTRLNSASDDAAGIAIASRLTADVRGTNQAIRNALDGQALIDTAEGAHKEIENILQRMREVSVQAANDTNNQQDRDNLQAEFHALSKEMDRIASTTTWAGQQMVSEAGSSFTFQVGAKTSDSDQITVSMSSMSAAGLGVATSAASTQNAGGGEEASGSRQQLGIETVSNSSNIISYGGVQEAGSEMTTTELVAISFGAGADVDNSTDIASKLQNGLLLKDTVNATGVTYTKVEVKDSMLSDLQSHLEQLVSLKQALNNSNSSSERVEAQNALGQKKIEISAYIGSFYRARDFDLKGVVNSDVDDDAIELVNTLNSDGGQGESLLAVEVDFQTLFQSLNQTNHGGGCTCPLCCSAAVAGTDGTAINAAPTNTNNEVFGVATTSSSNNEINALQMASQWDLSGDATLTYSFYNGTVDYSYDLNDGTPLDPSAYGDTNIASLREAFSLWDNITDFEFIEITESGTTVGELRNAYTATGAAPGAQAYARGPGDSPYSGDSWYVTVNSDGDPVMDLPNANDFDSSGHGSAGYNFSTAVHEIGHAIGLSHPFGHSASGDALDPEVDNFRKTIMSYTDHDRNRLFGWTEGNGTISSNYEWVYGSSPGMLDVEALTEMYGFENDGVSAGDTTLTFTPTNSSNGTYEKIHTIVDAGGDDVFDASAFTRDSTIKLTPGEFSSLGVYSMDDQISDLVAQYTNYSNLQTYFQSQVDNENTYYQAASMYSNVSRNIWFSGADNVGLSSGTWIEKAVGGSGNDTIIGNTLDNYLTGGAGNDTINGGTGYDIAIFNGAKSEFAITDVGNGSYTVAHETPAVESDGTDTLSGIEIARFSNDDGSYEYYNFSNQGVTVSTSETFSSSDSTVSIASGNGATNALIAIDGAIEKVNTQRAFLGAISNRLNHTVNNLTNISSNLTKARGGIQDTDFALETTKLAKNQILQQASIAMLAQANATKQNVLTLLRV